MNKISLLDLMNQKKPLSHLAFLLVSVAVILITVISGKFDLSFENIASAFTLIFCQLEVFIYFGNILFSKVNFDQSPGVITRIIFLRFAVFIAACLITAMILFLMLQYSILIMRGESLSGFLSNFFHNGFNNWFRSTISGLSAGAVIFIILLWQASLRREQRLREENLIFQNQTLKAQINPHFLFNSLNTLSSLIITKPDIAERFIARLSHIYRYITENSMQDRVPLERELDFIHDYFFLHMTRGEDKLILEETVQIREKYEILPVSLQVLVENAIKHNIATHENPLIIRIYLEDDMIVVRNNLQKMASKLKSTGTGLKNLSERIKLLTGKNLVIIESDREFIIKMPLMI